MPFPSSNDVVFATESNSNPGTLFYSPRVEQTVIHVKLSLLPFRELASLPPAPTITWFNYTPGQADRHGRRTHPRPGIPCKSSDVRWFSQIQFSLSTKHWQNTVWFTCDESILRKKVSSAVVFFCFIPPGFLFSRVGAADGRCRAKAGISKLQAKLSHPAAGFLKTRDSNYGHMCTP